MHLDARRARSFRHGRSRRYLCSRWPADGCVLAGFCSGTPAAFGFREWSFIKADLTVGLSRQPGGEWLLLDGESWIGPDGAGLAMWRLGDAHGYFGRAVLSLVIEKR